MTSVKTSVLNEVHRTYLNKAAITDAVLEAAGVTSAPGGIRFPYRSPDGTDVVQFRPDEPKTDEAGRPIKYVWPKGSPLVLNTLRDAGPESPALIVEGTKQALAVVSWAPVTYSVYGMSGCWGWSGSDLSVFEDRDVFIGLDGDAATNADVYNAGAALCTALTDVENAKVKFLRLPVAGTKEGADDWLSGVSEDKRTAKLVRLVVNAKNKPADRRPTTKPKPASDTPLPDTGDRPGVAVNLDRLQVITRLREVLKERLDARELFNFGGVLTMLRDNKTEPLNKGAFLNLVVENAACFDYKAATDRSPASFTPTWPDTQTVEALMGRADVFSVLDRVSRSPFVRPDGTLCAKSGYDEATRTMVILGSEMDRLSVPEDPTRTEARDAAGFLLGDWLGDMPFKGPEDRANSLALVLTPFIRGSVPLVPMAVISGLAPASGKGLLVQCVSTLASGETAPLMGVVENEEEMRKQVTSALMQGSDIVALDETHKIESETLQRALTSITWRDRVLGSSRMVDCSNRATWLAMGNHVRVVGDMFRRVYWIELAPEEERPEDRDVSKFRHPDLLGWTKEHRTELASAALTLIRAWYAAGKPHTTRGATMGSFESWDRLTHDILSYAGVQGFLGNLTERRKETDTFSGYWAAHLGWLQNTFGDDYFTTGQVRTRAVSDQDGFEAPPDYSKIPDITTPHWTRAMGQAYGQVKDRWFDGLRIIKDGTAHAKTTKWRIEERREQGGMGPKTLISPEDFKIPDTARTDAAEPEPVPQEPVLTGPVGFDLEGHDAKALYSFPKDGTYVRLAGFVDQQGFSDGTPDVGGFLNRIGSADLLYGHHVFGFDIPALALHHGADYDALAFRAWDTMTVEGLLEPPTARKSAPKGFYSLDESAKRHGVQGKTDNLRALALRHCPEEHADIKEEERFRIGLGLIPVDDPEYNAYLEGDLGSTKALYEAQLAKLEDRGLVGYARREMRIKAIQNRMTFNGWGIDEELLSERIQTEETRRQESLAWLSEHAGVPLTKSVSRGRGKARVTTQEPVLSPLGTGEGKAALIEAFRAAGAPHYPKTATGGLATSSDALGDGFYFVKDPVTKRLVKHPGMLNPQAYGHLDGVREICEHVATVTGTTAKYAEIQKYVVDGRVHGRVGSDEGDQGRSTDQASGRWALVKPSVTNLGKRGSKVEQRAVFSEIDQGRWHVAADFAQVDMRALAALSQDPAYMALFAVGAPDAHMEMAFAYFGERTKDARSRTKAINHGKNYGESDTAISERYGIPMDVVRQASEARAKAFPRLIEWTEKVRTWGASGELLDNGWGRPMRCDPARAYTQAPALMGQGCARDIMCEGLLRIVDRIPGVMEMFRAVVHDEVVLSVPEDRVDEVREGLADAMTFEYRGVPILAEVSQPGRSWADCYSGE